MIEEEVKKILTKLLRDCSHGLTTFSRQRIIDEAHQICQLKDEEIRELLDKIAEDAIVPIVNFYIPEEEDRHTAIDVWQGVKSLILKEKGGG